MTADSKYSEHPFGLYTTYVHNDDWSAYMASLGPEPIRPFDPIASKLLGDLTKATAQEAAQRKAQENKALEGVLDMTVTGPATDAGVKKGATPKNAPTVYTRRGGEFLWRRRLVNVRITYDKLAWAAGQTRPRTQQDVMGKTSASQIRQVHRACMASLLRYSWPSTRIGPIRLLRRLLRSAMLIRWSTVSILPR